MMSPFSAVLSWVIAKTARFGKSGYGSEDVLHLFAAGPVPDVGERTVLEPTEDSPGQAGIVGSDPFDQHRPTGEQLTDVC